VDSFSLRDDGRLPERPAALQHLIDKGALPANLDTESTLTALAYGGDIHPVAEGMSADEKTLIRGDAGAKADAGEMNQEAYTLVVSLL
jgi:hypothetical protein